MSNRTDQQLRHRTRYCPVFYEPVNMWVNHNAIGPCRIGPKILPASRPHQAAHLSRSPLSNFPLPSMSRLFMELIKFVSFRCGMWDLIIKKNKCLHCEDLNLRSKVYKRKRQPSCCTIPLLNMGNNILY